VNAWLLAAVVLYIGSRMTQREKVLFKFLVLTGFLIPISMVLWHMGAWQMMATELWMMISAAVALFMWALQVALEIVVLSV
jgi:hypothetical protein